MSADIVKFPKDNPRAAEAQPEIHSHTGHCLCESCVNNRRILETMHDRADSKSTQAYASSFMRGLEKWSENPKESMFEAVTQQLVTDGIIRQ